MSETLKLQVTEEFWTMAVVIKAEAEISKK